ncbi:hypothetical protein MPSEU_001024100 [Mayamaea pseudoterrestris]|nr:hypothetical protein MPSEU_001024100 [Mayamaea pseudoterrestris]
MRSMRTTQAASTSIDTSHVNMIAVNKSIMNAGLALILSSSSNQRTNKLTPFQVKVYTAVCLVPAGRVVTYQQLARHINCRSAQAVGQALKRNPYAPDVPCHRVVATNKLLGGFFGQRNGAELDRKKQMLLDEGVEFDMEGRVECKCFHVYK